MTTSTAERRGASFFTRSDEADFSRRDDGTGIVRKLKIFRAGSFKDSRGRLTTWSPADLADMVYNFNLLRSMGILPHVPVRLDHTASVKDVVGYFSDISTDGKFLYGDLELTEPDAASKFERGTLRGRSLEVGPYETNDGETHTPAVLGLAFVDMPAVEGLFSHQQGDNEFPVITDEEIQVTTASHTFTLGKDTSDDPAVVQAYIASLEARAAAADEVPSTFRINGADESDFARVQSHIEALETQRDEAGKLARAEYVKGLVDKKVLPATAEESTLALVAALDDTQFAAYRKSMDDLPQAGIFSRYGSDERGTDNQNGGEIQPSELDDAREVVRNHQRAGRTPEQIKATASFKKLEAAGEAPEL